MNMGYPYIICKMWAKQLTWPALWRVKVWHVDDRGLLSSFSLASERPAATPGCVVGCQSSVELSN